MRENKLPLTRDEAWNLVKKYNSDERDLIHYLESEAVMKELAKKLGENEEYFGMLGLLHDVDWGITKDNPQTHLTKTKNILKEIGFDDKFIEIIISHGYGFDCAGLLDKKRTQKEEFALAASETVTGLVHSYALMREGKITGMEASGLKKKFKDKRFAAAIRRDIIQEAENLGITLDEFFNIAIRGIEKIKDKVGLK
ncbi:MAG: HDIG domain-containing protein [Nanoarchaeota archaeon]|nr:HDIG domain-containing protein [Nanoarchaeota archaeon]